VTTPPTASIKIAKVQNRVTFFNMILFSSLFGLTTLYQPKVATIVGAVSVRKRTCALALTHYTDRNERISELTTINPFASSTMHPCRIVLLNNISAA
jgi:hypothetical protein